MIFPFHLAFTSGNTPQRPFNSVDNLILSGLVASNPLASFGLVAPSNGFGLSGIRVEADTAAVVIFGLWNSSTFYELWRTYATKVQYAQALALWAPESGFLSVPQGNSYVPAFMLGAGASVNISGELQIAITWRDAQTNTIT